MEEGGVRLGVAGEFTRRSFIGAALAAIGCRNLPNQIKPRSVRTTSFDDDYVFSEAQKLWLIEKAREYEMRQIVEQTPLSGRYRKEKSEVELHYIGAEYLKTSPLVSVFDVPNLYLGGGKVLDEYSGGPDGPR